MTERLAEPCDEVLAWDVVEAAVERSAHRLAGQPHSVIAHGSIPQDWPVGEFDLVVLSEVGYYCRDLAALVARVDASLAVDGVLVACHWRHPAPLHRHAARQVHAALAAPFTNIVTHIERDFLLDVWSRDGRSARHDEGIVA